MDDRTAEIDHHLKQVQQRINHAAAEYSSPQSPQLIVITKNFPAADVQRLASLGVTAVGENKDQEASTKVAAVADKSLDWHFVGQLQSNKASSVARYAAAVHSVDRMKIIRALSKGASAAIEAGQRPGALDCLIQVNLAPQVPGAALTGSGAARGGASPDHVLELADAIEAEAALRCKGLMAVAPLDADPDAAFAQLRRLAAQLQAQYEQANWISAGMSQDLEVAVKNGATHLRIGRDVLGQRDYDR